MGVNYIDSCVTVCSEDIAICQHYLGFTILKVVNG